MKNITKMFFKELGSLIFSIITELENRVSCAKSFVRIKICIKIIIYNYDSHCWIDIDYA